MSALTPERVATLYLSILPDMRAVCLGMARTPQQAEDNLGLVGLVFMEALKGDGRRALSDWACLKLRNSIQDERDRERIRRAFTITELPCPPDRLRDLWLDVSEDARLVARALLASDAAPTKAVAGISGEMYSEMTWRRFWNAVEELRNYMEA